MFRCPSETSGKKPLYFALSRGDKSLVQKLLDRRVLDFVEEGGPLDNAIAMQSKTAIRALLDCGVDPGARSSLYLTLISWSRIDGRILCKLS